MIPWDDLVTTKWDNGMVALYHDHAENSNWLCGPVGKVTVTHVD